LEADNLVSDYFALQKEESLISKDNWEMIQAHVNTIDSKEFKYLIANKKKFDDVYTSKVVNEKINDVHRSALFSVIKTKPLNEEVYNAKKEQILSLNIEGTNLVVFEADLRLARKKEDWKTFSAIAIQNVDVYYNDDADMLNSMAWDFYEK